MATEIQKLKKRKLMLMKKAGIKDASLNAKRARDAEKRKLKAEIFALENSGSERAIRNAKKIGGAFGSFVKRNATLVANNAVRLENERKAKAYALRMAEAKKKSPARKKKVVRKKRKKRY